MPALTTRRASLLAAAVAAVVFLPAVANGWALDDVGIVAENGRAHSIRAALDAFFSPYWPTTANKTGGLYRPLVILTYAVDWVLAGGRPWLAHLTNVLWHAVAAGLVVLVAAAWLPVSGALVAGLVFAVHPVHTEAVANVVGRAELLAAVCVLGAVLVARRARRAPSPTARFRWAALTVAIATCGLLVKEHAIVVLPIVALDHALSRPDGRRVTEAGLYLALIAVVLGWLHVWRAIASPYVLETVAAPFRDVGWSGRVAMMLPVQLDVVRLLVWPLELAADYNPYLVSPETSLSVTGVMGGITALAIVTLGLALWRRAPVVAFGILAGVVAYGPTANVLLPSGIVLSERTLYLPSLAVALAAGWLVAQSLALPIRTRRLVAVGLLIVGAIWVGRIETRIPFWRDTRTVVVEDYLAHPENYRAHIRAGGVFQMIGDTSSALREFQTATSLWQGDYVLTILTVRAARAVGADDVALREARRGAAAAPNDPVLADQLAATLAAHGRFDEALASLEGAIDRAPGFALLEGRYADVLEQAGEPTWRVALARGRAAWLEARPAAARALLVAAAAETPPNPGPEVCRDLDWSATLAENLVIEQASSLRATHRRICQDP